MERRRRRRRSTAATMMITPQGVSFNHLSARSNYNFEKPFLWLARRLTNQPQLVFQGEFAKAPEFQINPELVAQHEKELQAAQDQAIDDDDDDL
mmetsp:Transcript_23034/g.19064  ORF Transcript_23034/g.19064 Transcript_23034/m.19064 type:complete len:94 (-) Transcript_23034:49-330(-)